MYNGIRSIINVVGTDSFLKGRMYPSSYIRHVILMSKIEDMFMSIK